MAREGSYRIRHDKRRNPVRSSPSADTEARSDEGVYFRCWNCGWVCDKNRDALGNNVGSGDSTQYYTQYYPQSTQGSRSETTDYQLSLEGVTDSDVDTGARAGKAFARLAMRRGRAIVMESSADGTAKAVRLTYESLITKGCPLCGSTNYA
jgi:hypothetical protein